MRTATKPANMNQDQKAPLLVVPRAGTGEAKRSRRRRKNKGEEGSGSGDAKKRKLSKEQMKFLEMNFCKEHKLETKRKDQLATELGLHPRQVAVWFQNRRVRWKAQNREAEYFSLKSASERDFAEKYRLENQVMKLKEQLCQAEKQIEKFCEILNGMFATTSPSSSFFIDTNEHAFDGEFMVEGFGDLSCVPDANFIHGMDWMNFPGL